MKAMTFGPASIAGDHVPTCLNPCRRWHRLPRRSCRLRRFRRSKR